MSGKREGDPTDSYYRIISQYGYDEKLTGKLMGHFLEIRRGCLDELTDMKSLIDTLQPKPDYLVYRGAFEVLPGKFICHSESAKTVTKALLSIYNGEEGFTADSQQKIVAASPGISIPQVSVFSEVLESSSLKVLPDDHPAVALYSHTLAIIDHIRHAGTGSFDFLVLLLAEGVKEKISDISEMQSYF